VGVLGRLQVGLPSPPGADGGHAEGQERDRHPADREEPVERVGERDGDGCGGEADASDHAEDGGHPVAQVAGHAGHEGEQREAERPADRRLIAIQRGGVGETGSLIRASLSSRSRR
jgi:hypothetical protein